MKTRTLALLATAGFGFAASTSYAQEFAASVTAGLENEYVFRGVELAGESVQASIDASYGNGYFGVWTNEPLQKEYDSEYDFYAGYNYAIDDTFIADFGATVYYYPDAVGDDDTAEVYTGLTMDNEFAPSIYAFYDFDLENLTIETSLSKSFNLNEQSAVVVRGAIGWVNEKQDSEYYYYGVNADFVYSFSDTMRASIGARAGGNDEHRGPGGKENNAWAGASFTADF